MSSSQRAAAVATCSDKTLTASTTRTSERVISAARSHPVRQCEAQRQLQALDDCDDTDSNVHNTAVHRAAQLMSPQLTCSSSTRTSRRSVLFVVVDVDELSPWSSTVGRVVLDMQPTHPGKASRPRLNATEVSLLTSVIVLLSVTCSGILVQKSF